MNRKHLLTLLAALITVIAMTGAAGQQGTAPQVPDVVVLVASGLQPQDMVSVTYSSTVIEADVQKHLQSLRAATGWQIPDVKPSTSSVQIGGESPMTSVEFVLSPIVDRSAGTLPVEPFLVAFREYGLVEVNYMVQGTFNFSGLRDFSNDYVEMDFYRIENTYAYRTRIKDGSFERLGLPLVVQEKVGGPVEAETLEQTGGLTAFKVIAALAIAAFIGSGVYAIASRFGRPRQRQDKGNE